jgi:WD40 repeat protein
VLVRHAHTESISCVALNVEGTLVAVASEALCQVVRLDDEEVISSIGAPSSAEGRLAKHFPEIKAVCFSPDGERLVIVGLDGSVMYYNIKSQQVEAKRYPGQEGPGGEGQDGAGGGGQRQWRSALLCLAFSLDEGFLAAGCADGRVLRWNWTESRKPLELKPSAHYGGMAQSVSITADGSLVAAAFSDAMDPAMFVWDERTDWRPRKLVGHKGAVLAVRAALDGSFLVSGGADGGVRVWEVSHRGKRKEEAWHCTMVLGGHDGQVRDVDICDLRRWVATAGSDGTVQVIDLDSGLCMRRLVVSNQALHSVAISWDGSTVVTGGADKLPRVWDLEEGASMRVIESTCSAKPQALAVSHDQTRIAAVSVDRPDVVLLWGLETALHDPQAGPMELLAEARRSGADKRTPSAASSPAPELPPSVELLAFSRDSHFLFAACGTGQSALWIWRLADAKPAPKAVRTNFRFTGGGVSALAVSSKYLAVGCKDGSVRAWEVRSLDVYPRS